MSIFPQFSIKEHLLSLNSKIGEKKAITLWVGNSYRPGFYLPGALSG